MGVYYPKGYWSGANGNSCCKKDSFTLPSVVIEACHYSRQLNTTSPLKDKLRLLFNKQIWDMIYVSAECETRCCQKTFPWQIFTKRRGCVSRSSLNTSTISLPVEEQVASCPSGKSSLGCICLPDMFCHSVIWATYQVSLGEIGQSHFVMSAGHFLQLCRARKISLHAAIWLSQYW